MVPSTMPTRTQKLNTSAASSSLTTTRYTEMRFSKNIHTNKHQNAIVEEQLPFIGSLLGFFYFIFFDAVVSFCHSVSLFFALLRHAIVLQYYIHKLLLGLVGETQSLTWLGAKPILRGTRRDQVRCLTALAGYRKFVHTNEPLSAGEGI